MFNYHDAHGAFPPAALYDKEGKPLLSWRVLVLPYMEQAHLHRQFKLDEPWDGPHNRELLAKMPRVYEPFRGRATVQPYTTYYRVFVGPGAAFDGRWGLNSKTDFPDGCGITLLIVQAAEAVPWTKPAELPYGPDLPLPALGGIYPDTFQVVLADGFARSVPNTISEKTLRAAITRNGGEVLGTDW